MDELYSQTLEMRGHRRRVFLDYFLALDGQLIDPEQIVGSGWTVRLSQESQIGLGTITLPVVHVTFQADKETALKMIHAFRMNFLSAGG